MTSFLLSGPKLEPVTLADVIAFCEIDGDVNPSFLNQLIQVAREHVETVTNLALITQRWQLALDDFPSDREIRLPKFPIAELTARAYMADGHIRHLVPIEVNEERGIVVLPTFHKSPPLRATQAIEIDYSVGFGSQPENVPQELRTAILRLIQHWRDGHIGQPAGISYMVHNFRRAA